MATTTAPLVHPQGLDHANLKVRDAEASLRFYTQVLGLTLHSIRRRDAEGRAEFVELHAGRQRVFLMQSRDYAPPAGRDARGLNHICIEIAPTPPERLLADLRARGVVVRSGLARRESNHGPTVSIYVEDLDGHGIELMQYVARR